MVFTPEIQHRYRKLPYLKGKPSFGVSMLVFRGVRSYYELFVGFNPLAKNAAAKFNHYHFPRQQIQTFFLEPPK